VGTMTYDLSSLGWDAGFAAAYGPLDRSDTVAARVLRAELGVCTVIGADGVGRASIAGSLLLGAARAPAMLPCAGDWVVIRRWPDRRTTVEVVLPRRTALAGPALPGPALPGPALPGPALAGPAAAAVAGGPVLAANMDIVAVVQPLSAAAGLDELERLLTAAHQSGARTVIVLFGGGAGRDRAAEVRRVADAAPGVPVLGARPDPGGVLDALRELVAPGRTLALLGGGAADRSTLVEALAGATVLPAREQIGSGPETPRSRSAARNRVSARRRIAASSAMAAGAMAARNTRDGGGTGSGVVARPALVPVPGGGVLLDVPAGTGGERTFRPTGLTRVATQSGVLAAIPPAPPAAVPLAAVAGGRSGGRRERR
jgi:ribosome biogenesis GTPase